MRQRSQRRALDRARAALGHASARAPASRPPPDAAGRARDHDHARAGRPGRSRARSPRATMFSRSVSVRGEQVVEEVAHGGLARALGRLGPLDLEADQVRHEPQQRGAAAARRAGGSAAGRPAPRPRAARRVSRAALARHHRALVLGRRAGHRQHAARRRRARSRSRRARGPRRARPRAGRRRTRRPRRPRRAPPGRSAARRPPSWALRSCGHPAAITRTGRRSRRPPGRSPAPIPSSVPRMNSVRKLAASFSHSAPVAAPRGRHDQDRRSRRRPRRRPARSRSRSR